MEHYGLPEGVNFDHCLYEMPSNVLSVFQSVRQMGLLCDCANPFYQDLLKGDSDALPAIIKRISSEWQGLTGSKDVQVGLILTSPEYFNMVINIDLLFSSPDVARDGDFFTFMVIIPVHGVSASIPSGYPSSSV